MKVIGVIPARFASTRFHGKPLADICGKPMIWWVYNQVLKVKNLDNAYVATDDERIAEVCKQYNLKYIMTGDCKTSTNRIHEVAKKIEADLYLCINGDEPLIDPDVISAIIPEEPFDSDFYVSNLMTAIEDPVEAIDFTNIKIVTDSENNAMFLSRSPIPYPKSSMDYKYYKHVGVVIYTKSALDFYASTEKGKNEIVEDIDLLRFAEHQKKIKMVEVTAHSLSVDTPKDLENVRTVIAEKIKTGEIKL